MTDDKDETTTPDPSATPQDPNALQHVYSEDENAARMALRAGKPQAAHPIAGAAPNPTGLENKKKGQ